jgi:TetR/AcrR family transcriptional regulator
MAKTGRDQDTRQKILEVAETQFAMKGYPGAHLQSIAEEVGVQKTALYYYFESKEALYIAVLKRMLQDLERGVVAVTSRGEPSAEALERIVDDLNQMLAANRNYSQILIRIFVDRIAIDSTEIEPLIERVISPMLRFYRAGVDSGRLRKLSARHVFLTVMGASVFHYAARESSADILDVDDVFSPSAVEWRRAEVRRLLFRGIRPDDED